MLRGLDASGAALSAHEPPVIDLSAGERFGGTVTLYVHESPSPSGRRRFGAARERLELLREADVLGEARFVAWPDRVGRSATDAGAAVRSLYEGFRAAAGEAALGPAFERSQGELRVPELAAAARRDGRLVGFYPLATDGAVTSVEDGIERLSTGDGVENL